VTGFFNKQSFYTQMPQWDDDEYWPTSVVVCNVDGMRAINEAYGTEYGDGVMKQIARYIRRRAGDNAFCAKLDNGDIVIVFERTSDADASEIMDNVREELLDFYDHMPVSVSLEYGIATKDSAVVTMEKLLQDARTSMQNKKMLKERSASSSLVNSLKQTLAESDFQTEEHVERTRKMAARLGREMGLSDAIIGRLELLAALHDIGKVAIPQDIIKKRGKLTPEERKVIEQHTVKGYRIAKSSPELAEIADGILCHHEKWDGTGYPNALKGEEIPLIARIIAAVDSHDVMVNDRPYHKGMPEQDAIAELRRCSGTQFDPTIVEVFTRMLEREELHEEDGLPISSAALSAPDTAQPAAEMKAEDNADKTTEWPATEGNDSAGQADEDIDIRRLLAE
jgi:diguanylate cyclase (GGDEF)-like protein